MIDHTHDPLAQSWLASANAASADFPIQNLPLCVFRPAEGEAWRIGVGLGDQVIDVPAVLRTGLLSSLAMPVQTALQAPQLNALFALGRPATQALRLALWPLLLAASPAEARLRPCLQAQADVQFGVPCEIGDYTDFFSSLNHAMNTFQLFRPGQVFLPNFKHLPIAYHGRSSSIVISGTPVRRPLGLIRPNLEAPPLFEASRKIDIEVEIGLYVGAGNALGEPIALAEAEQHIIGFSVLNDWSARDVQAFESQPLGPFLSKNFASSVAPWVVTLEALAPFRAPLAERSADAPAPAPYLDDARNAAQGAFDIQIEARLQSAAMRERGESAARISLANFARDTYWTPGQMVAHHSVGGCNLRPGDFLGSGTISGPEAGTQGSLLELTWGGANPVTLPDGEQRAFVQDGDEITLNAWCEREGFRRIGLGACVGLISPARTR